MSASHTSSAYIDLTSEPSEPPEQSEPLEQSEPPVQSEPPQRSEPSETADSTEPRFVPSGYYGGGYIQMVKRVLQKCELEKRKSLEIIPTAAYMDRAVFLTGLHEDVLKRLLKSEILPTDQNIIDRSVIHNELVQFHLEKEIIPTTKQLYNALYGKIPTHIDIGTFRKLLIRMGYVWRKVAQNTLVVTERPSITFERVLYLKKIIHYREQKLPIYFIDENYFDRDRNYYNLQKDFVSQQQNSKAEQGVIYAVNRTGVHAKKYVTEFNAKQFQDWVSNELIHILRPQSIIVFKKISHHIQQIIVPPTLDSVKIEIIEWLDYHNIPHNKEMSKVELWSLIENYTNVNENMYIIDNILKTHGHTALHLPNCINELTPTSLVYELIKQNIKLISNKADIQAELDIIIDSIKTELKTYDDFMSSEEIFIYEEEMKVDSVFDGLIKKMSNVNISNDDDSDLPSCDSD